ncbi:MAG: division/cell wall cluster transcriptional repressor MraZ [Methylacidiphilales bacterium]|nr:division/cell wall cluster transcriptional repressor MraZ [Candidatus Methylacidiphilales bacterium]
MFRGTSEVSLDDKGRFLLPSKFRNIILSNGIIATKDPYDHCILLYPQSEWKIIEEKLSLLPNLEIEHRKVLRMLVGGAEELHLDKSGRLLLPSHLRAHAQMEKDAVCVGQMKKIEMWSAKKWNLLQDIDNQDRRLLNNSLESLCL